MERWIKQISNVEERVLGRIIEVWPNCQARFSTHDHEDPITRHLVKLLRQRTRKDPFTIDIQVEEIDPYDLENDVILGRVDIKVRFNWDDDVALIYECKRLNTVNENGKWESLATPYVTNGMMRFVDCQYGREVHVGGMLGYILDGDILKAKTSIDRAISNNTGTLMMTKTSETSMLVNNIMCFMTKHNRVNCFTPFTIHHNLLGL